LTYIDEVGQIYVLPDEFVPVLNFVREEIDAICESKRGRRRVSGWKEGDCLLAKHPKSTTSQLHRAKVMSVGYDAEGSHVLKVGDSRSITGFHIFE
jgi:hypothetical protein